MSSENSNNPEATPANDGGWRYKLGMAMFVLPVISLVLTPVIIPLLGMSAGDSAALIGGILVGGELIWFASIPLLGKEGFKRVKHAMFSKLALPDRPISRLRHGWGLSLLGAALAFQGLVLMWIIFGFFYLGADQLTESVHGLSFLQEATIVTYALIASVVAFFLGVWLLGQRFVNRLSEAMTWHDEGATA